MDSLALLYKIKESEEPRDPKFFSSDLHINYWKLPQKGKDYDRFIDIGVMMNNVNDDIEFVYVYFPFIVESNDLQDLGKVISRNNLLCVLFGGDYEVRDGISPSYCFVRSRSSQEKSFWVYQLDSPNFDLTRLKRGTIVKIKIKTYPENDSEIKNDDGSYNLYIRFRVSNLTPKSEYVCEEISNDFIQSAFSKTELIDLYINEKRNIDSSDYQDLSNLGNFFRFNKFHFFFVGSSLDETISGQTVYKNCCLLDNKKWDEYIGIHNPESRKCIAYHWKIEPDKERCSVFLKTVYTSLDKFKIFKYILIATSISLVASVIYDLFKFLLF